MDSVMGCIFRTNHRDTEDTEINIFHWAGDAAQ